MKPAFSLFWRTYALLLLLIVGSIGVAVGSLFALEVEDRVDDAAREAASLVNLARAGLVAAAEERRPAMLSDWDRREVVRIAPRALADRVEPAADGFFERAFARALARRLDETTAVASRVNGVPGLWISFRIGDQSWWLQTDPARLRWGSQTRLASWFAGSLLFALIAAGVTARAINRPVRELSFAASRIRGGDLDSQLDETTMNSEIREVNKNINKIARELARVEEDRAVMLAGISHDLRTPLARMRLEAEMSVVDEEARKNMAADIDQLDAIIGKFMDYARPGTAALKQVHLAQLIDKEASAFRDPNEIQIKSKVAIDLKVMAEEVELGRVFGNLFENARRYAKSPDTGIAMVSVGYVRTGPWVTVIVRDHGNGVPQEKLNQLTTPFYRGDAARTSAGGAGLGLAIVEKSLKRMGGSLELANAPDGGLIAHIRLRRV